jgi:hypothetical protein
MSLYQTRLIAPVIRALDALIATGREYEGLFPSILDRRNGVMLVELPPAIPGQRNGDRSHQGCNLMHDEATLKTLYALSVALDRPDYGDAADAYLRRFATHCTDTATGLFPWGEHSFWNLTGDQVGNSYVYDERFATMGEHLPATHDHLRQAPLWLWESLWSFNPLCVERFAEGLDFHWQEGQHDEYIRHANIEQRTHPTLYARSCDFPRHGGFYILDWVYAWLKTGRADFLDQISTMLDYWWDKRDARGLLLIESRCPSGNNPDFYNINSPGQTLSLAASLLESAALVHSKDQQLAAMMKERAAVYIDGFLAAPHDLENGVYVLLSRRDDNVLTQVMPIWGSVYGIWPASYVALTCLCAYRMTNDPRLLDWAAAVGRGYLSQSFPDNTAIPAMDAGLGLGLLADIYEITGNKDWINGAIVLADKLVSEYFDDAPLPRGAAGIDWYESQMGPGFLLHSLVRTALLTVDRGNCHLTADYSAR